VYVNEIKIIDMLLKCGMAMEREEREKRKCRWGVQGRTGRTCDLGGSKAAIGCKGQPAVQPLISCQYGKV
jgi:hypothetical protein